MSDPAALLKQQLNHAIQIASQQITAAKNHEWEQVHSLENQRQSVMKQCFANDIPESLAKLAKLGIEKLQQQETELLALTEASHNKTSDDIQKKQKGNQVTAAYQQQR